ncbi:MAG: ABC transporter ATP-binding protein [Rubrimonas sp.]
MNGSQAPSAPSDAALLRRLFAENARPHLRGYALAFLFMGLTAAATAASAWIMRDVINEIFVDRRADMVGPIAATVVAIFLIKGLATFGQSLVLSRIGARLVAGVQMRIMDNLLAQGMAFHDRVAAADLTTRMSYNASAARDLINTLVTAVGRDALAVVALAGVMIAQNPGMALAALLIGPPAVIGVGMLVRRVRKLARREFTSLARIVAVMNEFSRGIRVVKAFGLEPRLREEMSAAVRDVERRTVGIARLNALSSPLMETLGGLAIAAVILYAGRSVIVQGGDPGGFFAFLTAFLMAYDPAKRLARLNVSVQNQLVAVRLLYELLDTPPSLTDRAGAAPLRAGPGRITFDDVRFGYAASPALNGLTFAAEPGMVTALVGPSGAGKTTVFSLLARFYDPDAGTVAIDGQDLRGLTQASVRARLAVVGQDTFLFDDTIRENIRRGRPEADDAAVEAAARDANVWDFAAALPRGLDTPVGEAGGRLSGGQRQRVAIARAMVRDAPILLLDEATSALDAEAEAAVQQALDRLMTGRTTLVIAHRLATIRRADRIIVMRDGRVEEIGDHAALYAAGGLYRRLCDLQFGGAD